MKLTLDTNCFNRKPHRSLDKIFELEKQGEIKIFYADSLIDDVQEGNEKILSLPGNKQKAASERLRKAQQYKQIKSGITFRHPYNIFPIPFHDGDLFEKIKNILFPSGNADEKDVRHLIAHKRAGNDIFITLNTKDFDKKGKEEAKQLIELGIIIKTPEKFLDDWQKYGRDYLFKIQSNTITMPIKTYLFDFDDTIISTKIYAEMYQPILTLIKKKFKWTDQQLETKAKQLGLTKNKFNRWDTGDLCRELKLLDEYYKTLEEQIQVVPVLHKTVIKTLLKLKSNNKKVGIVSNSMRRTIQAYINKYKLDPYLDFVFSRDDANCKKQEETYWKVLIEKKKLKPAECLVIGDDPEQDEKVPKKLGFHTFLIKNPEDLEKVLEIAQ